jgi:uncharacterized cupredoxin-like copper-binding protein
MHGQNTRVAVAATIAIIGLAGCGASGALGGRDEPRTIDIGIDGYHFVPDHFEVATGESVRFMISNPDDIAHELFIGTAAEQAARRAAGVPEPSGAADVSHFGYGIYLPALSDGELDYAFSGDEDLLIGCHLPGHWEAGMVATIDVGD